MSTNAPRKLHPDEVIESEVDETPSPDGSTFWPLTSNDFEPWSKADRTPGP